MSGHSLTHNMCPGGVNISEEIYTIIYLRKQSLNNSKHTCWAYMFYENENVVHDKFDSTQWVGSKG